MGHWTLLCMHTGILRTAAWIFWDYPNIIVTIVVLHKDPQDAGAHCSKRLHYTFDLRIECNHWNSRLYYGVRQNISFKTGSNVLLHQNQYVKDVCKIPSRTRSPWLVALRTHVLPSAPRGEVVEPKSLNTCCRDSSSWLWCCVDGGVDLIQQPGAPEITLALPWRWCRTVFTEKLPSDVGLRYSTRKLLSSTLFFL